MTHTPFPWKRRWRLTLAILLWCGIMATYIIVRAPSDDRMRETALVSIFTLAGAVAGAYLGFATLDDRHARSMRHPREPPAPPEETGDPEN